MHRTLHVKFNKTQKMMYRFGFVNNVASKVVEADRQLFYNAIRRADVKLTCRQIAECMQRLHEMQAQLADNRAATGEKPCQGDDEAEQRIKEMQKQVGAMKRRLPAFCWHAVFSNGRRKNDEAIPSGLIMMDIDHVENPRALFEQTMQRIDRTILVAAHVTPSLEGLRLVLVIPQGMDIVTAQTYYMQLLQLQVDACTKDMARMSFCVPEDYWLFINDETLFGQDNLQPDAPVADVEQMSAPEPQQPAHTPQSDCLPQSIPSLPEKDEENNTYPDNYDGIPYDLLVESLCEQMGGVPAHGSRNSFIFTMAAHLRYVCDDDPLWICRVLPTYGEARNKWLRTIQSACQRSQYKVMPKVVERAIQQARNRMECSCAADDAEGDRPPQMPARLPPLIALLTKNVPEVCRPAVANAVFPSLGIHLHNVKFCLVDGTEKEPTFMCVTMARQSSGKASVNKPIEYIVADIVEQDEINRKREQEWKDLTQQRSANKEKPRRPEDLSVQVLVSDMTNAAFVQRLKDAGGRYLYTNLEELALLKQLQTNGSKDIGKIICLCFDNGRYGQERVGTGSVTARVQVRWNWNASSTIQAGIRFFKNRLVDGTLSRVNFCTIIPDKTKPFVYGVYDDDFARQLKPYITNLNLASGMVECKEALRLAERLLDKCLEIGELSDDGVYQDMAYRAVTIAHMKAVVLYIAHDMTWTREIADFVEWSLFYDLWCKRHFFGVKYHEESLKENVKSTAMKTNLLSMLPETFSRNDAMNVRRARGLDDDPREMLATWIYRGYIVKKDKNCYVKVAKPKKAKRKR